MTDNEARKEIRRLQKDTTLYQFTKIAIQWRRLKKTIIEEFKKLLN